jgi:hypothetical protein
MAGKIIADVIEAPYDRISLNVGNLTVLSANSSGLNFIPTGNVNVNIGGASANLTLNLLTANGIKFPATQVPSADANTLDDYEEGSWTPVIQGSSSNPTVVYDSQNSTYTKIGKLVTLNGYIQTSSRTGGGGDIRISGLPFTTGSSNHFGGTILLYAVNVGTVASVYASAPSSATYFSLLYSNNNGANWSNAIVGNIPNSLAAITFTIQYQI